MLYVDAFCSAGGWTTGLKAAGHTHVVGIEIDPKAAATYEANHGKNSVIVKSVTDINSTDLLPYLKGRKLDLLVASPPCTSFSLAGNYNERNDALDLLYVEVVRIARLYEPKMVLIENVVQFATKKIAGTDRTAADDMVARLRRAGYGTVEMRVLKSEDYEVPQIRRRLIIIARRSGPVAFPEPVTGYDPSLKRFLQPASSVTNPFYWLTPQKVKYYEERQKRMPSFVRFIDPSQPARTVRSSYYKSRGSEALLRQGSRVRMLTEVELKRIQTFPESYKFVGAHGTVCKQIGIAVPVKLAYHIGKAIKKLAVTH